MKYSQGDIVEINFLFPDGIVKPHPALIVSNEELQDLEGFIYMALISSKDYNEQYSYELYDEMLDFKMNNKSYVKCHIIVGNIERDVIRKLGRLKNPYFEEIKNKIIESIF